MSRNIPASKIPASYWEECLQDEYNLAPLMGWARLSMPEQRHAGAWIFGSNYAEFTSEVGPQITSSGPIPVPQWRRDTGAMGALIEKLLPNVQWFGGEVKVWISAGDDGRFEARALSADHPSDGHALRKALVQLAIAYLGERRDEQEKQRRELFKRPQLSDWRID